MDVYIGMVIAAAGLAVGAVLAAVFFRYRSEMVVDAAVSHARSGLEIELATQLERLHATEAELGAARQDVVHLSEAMEGWRKAADVASADKARLAERASRLPILEAQAARMTLQVRMGEEQLRRLAASEAHKDESLRSAQAQVQQLETAQGALQARLDAAVQALHRAGERRAVLEEQAARAHGMEQQLRQAQQRWSACQQELVDQRSAAEQERRRLNSELAAARDALERVRGELAAARALLLAADAQAGRDAAPPRSRGEGRAFEAVPVASRTAVAPAARRTGTVLPVLEALPDSWSASMLARVLEQAGLAEAPQGLATGGTLLLTLGRGQRLWLDADLPLDGFEQYAAATSEAGRRAALDAHLDALHAHVGAVAAKARADAAPPDLVLLFVPVDAAFVLALSQGERLLAEAWRQDVLLAGPSTLLFMLRMLELLWRRDAQAREGLALAAQGALLRERLAGVCGKLDGLGGRLGDARLAIEGLQGILGLSDGKVGKGGHPGSDESPSLAAAVPAS